MVMVVFQIQVHWPQGATRSLKMLPPHQTKASLTTGLATYLEL